MRRRIIIGLAIYALVLVFSSLYVVDAIRSSTSRMDNLIVLHQAEILRDHYLNEIRSVQTDLALADAENPKNFKILFSTAREMDRIVGTCADCHHDRQTAKMILDLRQRSSSYKESVSRVLTMRASPARLDAERNAALAIGEKLTQTVAEMTASTGARLAQATRRTLNGIENTTRIVYLLVGIGPLASLVLGWVIVSGLTSPLRVLVDSTKRLKRGDLDHRVVGLRHEFGQLGQAFNEMAASLKVQMSKMQRAEQMAVAGELAAGLAHEIKNPLAGIKLAMNVLEDEAGLAAEDRAVLRKVTREVARLESLMKSFLNFTKPPKPQLTSVNVNEVMNTALALHGDRQADSSEKLKGIRIEKELGHVPPTLADPTQLQQVFLNLLINGMDAMPKGGVITVRSSVEAGGEAIKIEVADTGEGIDPDRADQIFKPFFTTKPGGTGLGLPISGQLIEQHGGSISAGGNPGGGTVFTIRLPLLPNDFEA